MSTSIRRDTTTWPLGEGVALLAQDDNGLIALAKPAGLLSHPNERDDEARSLLNAPYQKDGERYEWKNASGQPVRAWLLNRLDSATSGVLLLATSEALATEIRALFRHKHIRKTYNALVFGTPSEPRQLWRDFLAVDKRGGQIRTSAEGNIPSEAHMRVLHQRRGKAGLALLQLEPRTGRSHQLRVQCAKRGLPIIGDATYGDFSANRDYAKTTGEKRLFLHSLETEFSYVWRGKTYPFTAHAPLPPEFTAWCTPQE